MPKEAKVFIAEDNKMWRGIIKRRLSSSGHTIVLEAGSLEEALENVNLAREREVNVGVLDGSLNEDILTEDGLRIAHALRKEVPGIKIVSLSGRPADWGDVNLKKEDASRLAEIVTEL